MKVVEKIKKHILCPVFFLNRAFLDNVEKYCRIGQATDDNIIWPMHFACYITKVTGTNSEGVKLIAFPRQQISRKRASMLRYT